MKIILFASLSVIFAMPIVSMAQTEGVVKVVTLDSVVIKAVKSGFSIEDFIRMMSRDTSFYQAFKNLRQFGFESTSRIVVFNHREKEVATMERLAIQEVESGHFKMSVISETATGNMYRKNKEFRYFTAHTFDRVFYPRYGIKSNIGINSDKTKNTTKGKPDRYYDNIKTFIFNPGTETIDIPVIGNRLGIFKSEMQKYYDYNISSGNSSDLTDCYIFSCKIDDELGANKSEKPVIKELVTWFDKSSLRIMERKYKVSYVSALAGVDAQIHVTLIHHKGDIVPRKVVYTGVWDLPFKRAEYVHFSILFDNFK
jgi:hypothetical protein